jgi:hypothetical protein
MKDSVAVFVDFIFDSMIEADAMQVDEILYPIFF